MNTKSQQSAGIAAALSIAVGVCMAFVSPSGFAAPSETKSATPEQSANSLQRGVVLLVHPQKSTAAFLSILDLPVPLSDKGRFAVLNVLGAENTGARYALAYVPQGVEVNPHDVVALELDFSDLVRQSGQAAVAMLVSKGANLSAKAFGGEVSNVVMVPAKDGSPELWIEDQHTGEVKIFAVRQGNIRIQ
jgi:hypothetical protein